MYIKGYQRSVVGVKKYRPVLNRIIITFAPGMSGIITFSPIALFI
jgi:hypothetical protein